MTTTLFTPYTIRQHTIANRLWVAPMCQYSADDSGMPTAWHQVHYGQFATGGAGLIMVEATAVTPEGRITPSDLGIWDDAHITAFTPITQFLTDHGATPAIQLAHAGRKASTWPPATGNSGTIPPTQGGWETLAPSALPFGSESGVPEADQYATPRAMTEDDITSVIANFVAAATRAIAAGFQVLEVHAAHGYLLHEFLSPLTNTRTDQWGGDITNRSRLAVNIVAAIREHHPEVPLFVRISATDWVDGGYTLDDATITSQLLRDAGADLIDVSTGGNVARAPIPAAPGYQIPHAEHIARNANIAVSGVGMITDPHQADSYIREGRVDAIMVARHMMRDPHFALRAADTLGQDVHWPAQYSRAQGFPA